MRSCNTILLSILLVGTALHAQVNTISPFSRISIGDFQRPNLAQNFAMGGLNIGMQGSSNINFYNPASYSRLGWTTFEVAVVSNNLWMNTENQSQSGNLTNFNHLIMGFPVAPWWGLSFGIIPFSQVGYNYRTSQTYTSADTNEVNYDNEFLGSGGLNRIFLGNGFSINRTLFFGFNFSYCFGDMEYQETLLFTDNDDYNNSANLERIETGDAYFDFGMQYKRNLGNKWRMDLGVVFTPLQGLSSKRSLFNFTYSDLSTNPQIIDTVSFSENASFSIVLPPKYGFGFVMHRGDKFKAGLDVEYTLWSQSNYNTYGGLEDVYTLRFGMEKGNILEDKYTWRFGARYGKMPIVLNNSRSEEVALSAGIALPFRTKDKLSLTVLSIGAEVGQRGKTEDQWLQERFIRINVALTLNNKWFDKRVYD